MYGSQQRFKRQGNFLEVFLYHVSFYILTYIWGRRLNFNHSNLSEGTIHICGSKFVIGCVCVCVCVGGRRPHVICQY